MQKKKSVLTKKDKMAMQNPAAARSRIRQLAHETQVGHSSM